jgi:hypothetical protein
MRNTSTIVFAIAVSAALGGCSSMPTEVINPPRASIQQLAVQPQGHWQLTVRLQNFSSVSTTFQTVSAKLVMAGQDAGTILLTPDMSIGPESADAFAASLAPALGAKLAVASALAAGQPVRYVISGRIDTSTPKGSYDFSYESTLNPAPGLTGVLR